MSFESIIYFKIHSEKPGVVRTLILTRIFGRQRTTSEFAINQAKAQSK